jgi:hypothetical protein
VPHTAADSRDVFLTVSEPRRPRHATAPLSGSRMRSVMRPCRLHQADDACIREVASARAALPPHSPWTTNRSVTWPDPLHPVHRHHVGACELAIGGSSSTVAVAMRQKRQCRVQAKGIAEGLRSRVYPFSSEKRSTALRSGWRMSTSGAATAPLCLNRKARFVPSADSSAQMSPTPTDSETPVTAEPSSERSQNAKALPPKRGPSSATHGTPSSSWRTPERSSRRAAYFPRHRAHAPCRVR